MNIRVVLLLTLLPIVASGNQAGVSHHDIVVSFNSDNGELKVKDTLSFSEKFRGVFYLHKNLKVKRTPGLRFLGEESNALVPLNKYQILGRKKIRLQYGGKILHQIKQRTAEYARSMQETPGIISNRGVFLAGSSYWLPSIKGKNITFRLRVKDHENWRFMSQGKMSQTNGMTQFEEKHPQEEIYLIGGRYQHYREKHGKWTVGVYLREKDDALANKYLDVTGQYLQMFSELLGDYPYSKFYMVENFWDTGYGMPSFTLLGPRVIRFPFILHSSYPHEILHNWWGNAVYTDYATGNWAEGLTSYLADHLIQEQKSRGSIYRRNTLQKYTDYVSDNKEFSLSQFTSRHSSASQAIGYGKTLMFFHMLRNEIGDEKFKTVMREFFLQYKFKTASFNDIKSVSEKVAKRSLALFFQQWVEEKGAPVLHIKSAKFSKSNKKELLLTLQQKQPAKPYKLNIPIRIVYKGGEEQTQSIEMNQRTQVFHIKVDKHPQHLEVDPGFDLFRRLHHDEIPPALSKLFGAEEALVILPSKASKKMQDTYKKLISLWGRRSESKFIVTTDDKLDKIPAQSAVWILGWENRFKEVLDEAIKKYSVKVNKQAYQIDSNKVSRHNSIVLTARNPADNRGVMGFLSTDIPQAINGLARKLPHYGKYSFLAFKGTEPQNFVKGQWSTVSSPMQVSFSAAPVTPKKKKEVALIDAPSQFSKSNLQRHISELAGPNTQGRELGSKDLDRAANYIAGEFRKFGLKPMGNRGYFQVWKQTVKEKGKLELKNVLAYLPGKNNNHKAQSVVVAAHYDHLGKGWPDVHKGDKGKIHYGANDNASGVSVLLEFARLAAEKWQPERSIIFAAFTGEESGLLGSKYFTLNHGRFPVGEVLAMINLDTVGRLKNDTLQVFGVDTAREWVHIIRGVSYVTGVKMKPINHDIGASDNSSYIAKGIPAIMLFGGAHSDYHRPSDVQQKIDYSALQKVLMVVKESVDHLANRQGKLAVQISGYESNSKSTSSGRKVHLGTIPDFAFNGGGIRLTGVVPNSPAQRAGLQKGDIIIRINENSIKDLRAFAAYLRTLKSGDGIKIMFRRNNQIMKVSTKVVAR